MGNTNLMDKVVVDGKDDQVLKCRTGVISKPVPLSEAGDSYEEIYSSRSFREKFLSELGDDYFVQTFLSEETLSLLSKRHEGSSSTVEEEPGKLQQDLLNMKHCAQAGLKLNIDEVLSVLEKQLKQQSQTKSLPFIGAFDRRMVLFRNVLLESLQHERKMTATAECRMELLDSPMNSLALPQVKPVQAIATFGFKMLSMLPFVLSSTDTVRITTALEELCCVLTSFEDEELFRTWSPRLKAPMKQLSITSVAASSLSTTSLSWSGIGGVVDIKLEKPSMISFIRLSWIPPKGSNRSATETLGAPQSLTIFVKIAGSETFESVWIGSPEAEKERQGSWSQYLLIDRSNVEELKILVSQQLSNSSSLTKSCIYELTVFDSSKPVQVLHTMDLLQNIQTSMSKLIAFPEHVDSVLMAGIGLLKASASLTFGLRFLWSSPLPSFLIRNLSPEVKRVFFDLLRAIRASETKATEEFNRKYAAVIQGVEGIKFEDRYLTDTCKLMDSGKVLEVSSGACCGVIARTPTDSAVYEWELLLSDVEKVSIGVVIMPAKYEIETIASHAWLYVCGTGELVAKGEKSDRHIAPASTGNLIKLVHTQDTGLVSLSINGVYHGVIFEQVSSHAIPIVLFGTAKSLRTVSLVSFQLTPMTTQRTIAALPLPHEFVEEDLQYADEDITMADIIFQFQAKLALSQSNIMALKDSSASTEADKTQLQLDYPFCAEVSLDTFKQLSDILNSEGQTDDRTLHAIQLLDLQLHILKSTELALHTLDASPVVLANTTLCTEAEQRVTDCMSSIKSFLLASLANENELIRQNVVRAFCRGINTFLPTIKEKVLMVVQMMNSSQSDVGVRSQDYLLITVNIIEGLCNVKVVQDMLKICELATNEIESFYFMLLDRLFEYELDFVDATEGEATKRSILVLGKQLFSRFVEEILFRRSNGAMAWVDDLLMSLIKGCVTKAISFIETLTSNHTIGDSRKDALLRDSLIGKVLQPALHAFVSVSWSMDVIEKVGSCIIELVGELTLFNNSLNTAKVAMNQLSLCVDPLCSERGMSVGSGGWRVLKTTFEDSDSSFSVTDNGLTYTSLHSTNTCALVNVCFGPGQKAAWEFQLETDSQADECSVFGAARKPLTSRCYSSSQDLWMRRSYNGYMYAQGSTTGQSMEKIHPGDIVRIEFDGDKGTLMFSLNGSEPELGFSDIRDEIYPACGSYRNGVVIKLLKVEVYQSMGLEDNVTEQFEQRPTADISWVASDLTAVVQSNGDSSLLVHPLSREKSKVLKAAKKWITARGNRGACQGVHRWAFEFEELPDGPYAVGFSSNSVAMSTKLASTESADTTGFAFAWNSDGSIWYNGKKVMDDYGLGFMPLKKKSVVTMTVDFEQSIIYFDINGQRVDGNRRLKPESLKLPSFGSQFMFLFPAASLSRCGSKVRIRAAGLNGSTVLPFAVDFKIAASCILGQLTSTMMMFPSPNEKELQLLPWLQSPIMLGGVSNDVFDSKRLQMLDENDFNAILAEMNKSRDLTQIPESSSVLDSKELIWKMAYAGKGDLGLDDEVSRVYEWFETLDPEQATLRKLLERSKSYRFPVCELPFVACLIKHSGCQEELLCVSQSLSESIPVECSAELFLAWQKTKQLRFFLRMQRQKLMTAAADALPLVVESLEKPLETVNEGDKISFEPNSSAKIDAEQGIEAKIETNESSQASATESTTVAVDAPLFSFGAALDWKTVPDQKLLKISSVNTTITFIRWSFDHSNYRLLVEIDARTDNRSLDVSTASLEKVAAILNDTMSLGLPIFLAAEKASNKVKGLLIFEANDESNVMVNKVDLTVVEDEAAACIECTLYDMMTTLKANGQVFSGHAFEELCLKLRRKAQFLFLISPVGQQAHLDTRSALLGLSSRYSGSVSVLASKADLSRWRTQERWRKVVEFLHVHSKVKRQLSREYSQDASTGHFSNGHGKTVVASSSGTGKEEQSRSKESSVSNSQAIIQACGVFITSDEISWDSQILKGILLSRMQRARYRATALKLLSKQFGIIDGPADPFSVHAVLSFVKDSLPPISLQLEKASRSRPTVNHYLTSLEGCSTAALREVQEAFSDLYSTFATCLSAMLKVWESDGSVFRSPVLMFPIINLLHMWIINYSGRDVGWIQISGILPLLQKLTSFQLNEKVCQAWKQSSTQAVKISLQLFDQDKSLHMKLRPQAYVEKALLDGTMAGRELLAHSILIAKSCLTDKERCSIPLADWVAQSTQPIVDIKFAQLAYFDVLSVFAKRSDDVEAKSKKAEAKTESVIAPSIARLCFNPEQCAEDIVLSGSNDVATIASNGGGIAAMVFTNVAYSSESIEATGNYFEVSIIRAGAADIGIGFAVADIPVGGNMPGWPDHSYGLHGDDGETHGHHRDFLGTWPTFENGDTIGCGINFADHTIFFTRNGEMLGVGFSGFDETSLIAAVGFSNQNNHTASVRINFGSQDFVYLGSEVIISTQIAQERSRLQKETEAISAIISSPAINIGLEDTNRNHSIQTIFKKYCELELQVSELHLLKNLSAQLTQYFLLSLCKVSEESLVVPVITGATMPDKLVLLKDISTFGSSNEENKLDAKQLRSSVISAMCHELTIGMQYLKQLTLEPKSLQMLDDEHLNSSANGDEKQYSEIILEPQEIDISLQALLTPILCLLACNRDVSDDLCRSKVLSVLFQLVGSGLHKCSQLAVSILRGIIPTIEPSRVEESVTADMIASIDIALDERSTGEAKRKVRKFPDYFVRFLISQAAQLLHRQPTEIGQNFAGQPYGSGYLWLSTGQTMIALLRKLLEAPLWTEIVAYNIVLRLKAVEALLSNPIDEYEHYSFASIPAACVVCFCIAAFPMLNSESVVETTIGTKFQVINASEFCETVDAVMQTNLRELHFTNHVESVSRSCLKLNKVEAKVDFGKLSQPILSQLVIVAKQCFTMITMPLKFGALGQQLVLSKLCSTVSWTLSSLIDSQPEFLLDLLHEADLMRDVGKLAGFPQPVQQILPFQQLQSMWSFTQQRSLEQLLVSVPGPTSLSTTVSSSDKEIMSESKPIPTAEMEISSLARASRQTLIEAFAESSNISIPCAMMLFEFASGDIEIAKQLLTAQPTVDSTEETNSWTLQLKVDETKEQCNVSDENILKGITHSTADGDEDDSLSSSRWRILESINEEATVDLNRLVIISSEEGKGKIEYDEIGALRKVIAGSTDSIVEFLDFETGLSYFRSTSIGGLRRLKDWCGVSLDALSKSVIDVDMSVVISSMRLVVSKLLSSNLVSAKRIFNNDKLQALSAIKLIAGTNDRNLNGFLPGIIEGFATSQSFVSESAAAVESSDEFDLVSSLVEDSQKMLESICVVNLLKRRDQDIAGPSFSESDYFRLSSPHPFPAPFKSVGKISVPSSWSGGSIRFNPKCCTPSEQASLSLYFGETEYKSGTPSFCFFGSKDNKSYFQDASVAAGTTIYYVFEAKENSRRLEFEVKDVSGNGEIEDGFWQVKRVAPIGLGEEDTLFNLFEGTTVQTGAKALIMADCVWLKSGCCHVQVLFSCKDEADGDTDTISSFGFANETFCTKEDRDTSEPHRGCIWLHSDGSVVSPDEGRVEASLKDWHDSDVLDAIITITDKTYTVRFAKNGVWNDRVFSSDLVTEGVRPGVVLSGNLRAKFNLSRNSMLYSLPEEFNSVAPVKSLMEMQPENLNSAWGYDFVVQPVADLDIIVTNEFELIWSSKTDETTSTVKPGEATKKFWVWRAVAKKSSYSPPADIVTTTSVPPARSILINRSMCKNPTSYSCVFFSAKANFAVWRPKPPDNYVCLGDVITNGNSASSPPSTSLFVCVPKWTTKSCEVLTKVSMFKKLGEGKAITNGTIWKLNNNLGYFFGSPYSQRKSDAPRSADFRFDGVATGFTLLADVASLVAAEWYSEANITRQPSLNWVREVIRCLLENKKWRLSVLNESMFTSIIKYMRSSTAAAPVKMTPILIQMVRFAQTEHVSLPLQDVKSLCNVILNEALSIIQNNKKSEVSKQLMSLVDLVVEIQAVHVSESSRADRHSKSRILLKEKLQREYEESKEEEYVESKEEEKSGESVEKDSSISIQNLTSEALALRNNWWERPALDITDVKLHRVMRKDNVENIFIKDNMLLKLKQALKFLFAVQKTDLASNEDSGDVAGVTFERNYPKLMISKLWYEYVSRCAFLESRHPYRENKYKRIVSFPGVDHLTVTLDKRSSLCPGDKLTLSVPGGSSFELTSDTVESATKNVQFVSDVLIVTFEADTSKPVNEAREWGWALLIAASNQKLYETAQVSIDLRKELESTIKIAAAGARKSFDVDSEIFVNERQRSASYNSDSDSGSVDSVPGCPLELDLVLKPPIVDFHALAKEEHAKATFAADEETGLTGSSLPRPQSKRGGKRSKKVETKPLGPDPEKEIVVNFGMLIKRGLLTVPHATELDVKIDRLTPATCPEGYTSDKFMYVLQTYGKKSDDTIRYVLTPNSSTKVTVDGPGMHYSIWAMENAKVQEIINPPKIQGATEELVSSPGGSETNIEDLTELASRLFPSDKAGGKECSNDLAAAEVRSTSVAGTEAADLPPEPPEPEVIGWQCSVCTLINATGDETCEVCGARREASAADSIGAGWWCPTCTLINPLSTHECTACGTARPADPSATAEAKPDETDSTRGGDTPSKSERSGSKSPVAMPAVTIGGALPTTTTSSFDEVRITAVGKFSNLGKFETRLEAAILSKGVILTPLQVQYRIAHWSKECDMALLEFLNNPANAKSDSSSYPLSFTLPKSFLAYRGAVLQRLNLLDVVIRTQMIEAFNKTLEVLLPLIDLSNDDPHSLGALIRRSNHYLLLKSKMPLLRKVISATEVSSGGDVPASLSLSNYKSLLSRDKSEKDPTNSQNCFVQAFRQLQKKDSAVYRNPNERVFTISFADESGIDAGGVFREGMSRIVEDLFSEHFNLLQLCPNGQEDVHAGLDKFVPNPKHTSPLAMEMFEFIGKLMATSIRAKLCLSFEFPPLIWKKMVGEEVTNFDLMEVDMIAAKQLDELENCDQDASDPVLDQEAFAMKFDGKFKFCYIGSDKELHELCAGGAAKEVTFENRLEYCSAVRKARLNEFDEQVKAITKGMGIVIPPRALLLFSASQLEELVCGSPDINVELWQQNTEASGVSAETVALFWKVMKSLTPKEQSGFIRFAWGRSRLPARKEDFNTKMRLTSGGRAAMPVSHTCFFSIELPEYRTDEEMRHGLLTAIYYGVGGILNG